MAAFFGLARRGRHERAGFQLYAAAVAAAREPVLYQVLRVADTLDGRFDLVCLHAVLLVRRLQREAEPGPALAQAVFDAMFTDMDVSLREMGVGDLSVGRRVRAMWEAFNGRALAYDAALAAGDLAALEAALVRNVWRGAPPPEGCAAALARLVSAQAAHLDAQDFAALADGQLVFPTAAETIPATEATQAVQALPTAEATPKAEASR
ncbi:MAG TPA: ubiquinol-cytochrome C chaperone family protein [Acetobacteraceae bacterium]|nr:ubiquinol-cytochrome C chaperone family protein [Acetobacteraceae bacterium]